MRQTNGKSPQETLAYLEEKARWLRKEIIRLTMIAGGAHVGGGLSMTDTIVALFYHGMELKAGDPAWKDRDRFILSKGHGAVAYCPILADLGYFPKEWLDTFNHLDSPFGMHPDMNKIPGVEMSTGSLGHGLSVGVGFAIAARMDKKGYRIFVLMGDGEVSEGMVWEAAAAASQFKLGNITAIIDRNNLCLDGKTEEIMGIEPIKDRWEAFGWRVVEVDGHDMGKLVSTFDGLPPTSDAKPTLIVSRTIKGKGVDFMEGDPMWHYAGLTPEMAEKAQKSIDEKFSERRS
jgi:transketolase